MHFNHYLQALDQDAPPQWRGKFLEYKVLKKQIKGLGCAPAEGAPGAGERKKGGGGCDPIKDTKFMDHLMHEVQRINREFTRATRQVLHEDAAGRKESSSWCSCFRSSQAPEAVDPEELAERAEWCRRYAQINSVALRKIVKKHDKVCGCKTGTEFLQSVWSGARRRQGTFLHSPMIDELKSLRAMLLAERAKSGDGSHRLQPAHTVSVELSDHSADYSGGSDRADLPMLPSLQLNMRVRQHFESARSDDSAHNGAGDDDDEEQHSVHVRSGVPSLPQAQQAQAAGTPSEDPPLERPPAAEGSPGEQARAMAANEAAMRDVLDLRHISLVSSGVGDGEVDPEYVCPVCLEAMYQPLGLECGHKFCADCAFSSIGKGNAVGSVRAILDHVDPDAACPECRTKGVFSHAMELKATEKLIKQRYPKAWAERAEDARAKERRLRALLHEQRMQQNTMFAARMPF